MAILAAFWCIIRVYSSGIPNEFNFFHLTHTQDCYNTLGNWHSDFLSRENDSVDITL